MLGREQKIEMKGIYMNWYISSPPVDKWYLGNAYLFGTAEEAEAYTKLTGETLRLCDDRGLVMVTSPAEDYLLSECLKEI